MHQNIIEVKTPKEFEDKVLKSDKPVIVDFYADWCGPCKVLKPKLHDLADKNEGKWTLAVLNVDIEELGSISQKYASQGIPAVYLFHNGAVAGQFLGNNEVKAKELAAKAAGLA